MSIDIPTRTEWQKKRTVPKGAVSGVNMGKAFEKFEQAPSARDAVPYLAALEALSVSTTKYLAGVKKKFGKDKTHAKFLEYFEEVHESVLELIESTKARITPGKALRKAVTAARAAALRLVGKADKNKLDHLYSEELRGIGLPFKNWVKQEPDHKGLLDGWEKTTAKWKFSDAKDGPSAERLLTTIIDDVEGLSTQLTAAKI